MTSYSISRNTEDEINIEKKHGSLSGRKKLYQSFIHPESDQHETNYINDKLQLYNRRMLENTERRDNNLKTRVQPIKDHLNKITTVLKIINQSKEDLLKDSLLSYYNKEKNIKEARKKRKQMNIKNVTEQDINFSNGNYNIYL
jgi:spore coat polysaccharide biosynthesis protein SpsF (cytidylyltransferase family)